VLLLSPNEGPNALPLFLSVLRENACEPGKGGSDQESMERGFFSGSSSNPMKSPIKVMMIRKRGINEKSHLFLFIPSRAV
jgi:hypothetical protein